MEDDRKSDSDSLKRRHFKKLHERIQNKYNAMKMKLDKSKSMGSLTSISDDFDYRDHKSSSHVDLRVNGEENNETNNNKHNVKYSVIEDTVKINKNDATLQEISYDEAVYESDLPNTPETDNNNNGKLNHFFQDNISVSLESLNEDTLETLLDDEYQPVLPPSTPPPKISLRDRIGSRISAVREKRRREDKEKNTNKDKKKESREKGEKFILSNTTKQDVVKKKQKVATVTIALIDATESENETSTEDKAHIYNCRFKLGNEKRKSKSVRTYSATVSWQELFNLNMYDDDHMLEISMFEKNAFQGRSLVDLSEVEKERTHKLTLNLVDGPATNIQIFILLTISGTTLANTFIDLDDYQVIQKKLDSDANKYTWYHLSDIRDDSIDVGCLSVIVYGAKGLSSNECYCVLELGNERLQTLADYKTYDPNWMKIFTFAVSDVTSILDVTVFDEKKSEDVGKISIPLLRINNGQKKWYALKDSTQRERAKGNNPRVLLEMRFTWNVVKASVRAINRKEVKYIQPEPKLDRQTFSRNWSRVRVASNWIRDAFKVIKTCFEWESKKSNVIALTIWLLFCWFFKIWMLPLLLLIPFVWYRRQEYFIFYWKPYVQDGKTINEVDEKEEKNSTSLRQKLNSLQDMVQTVQNAIGKVASLGEGIKNLYNFTVPFLSFLAIFIVCLISFVMYLIPVNYIFMFWGVHKFTRKIRNPNRIPNNEILDLLSRVPDDEILLDCEEIPVQDSDDREI